MTGYDSHDVCMTYILNDEEHDLILRRGDAPECD